MNKTQIIIKCAHCGRVLREVELINVPEVVALQTPFCPICRVDAVCDCVEEIQTAFNLGVSKGMRKAKVR